MGKYIFVNKKLVTENKAKIPIGDRGFLYGDGLFETMRGYSGNVFMFDAHLQRLFSSLNILKYKLNFDKSHIKLAVQKILNKNRLNTCDSYIKLIVTRGIYNGGLPFKSSASPNLIIIAKELISYPDDNYKKGIKVISSSVKRVRIGNPLYIHKLLNYFENIYARDEAYQNGAQEAIFLTRDHLVLEGATSNIFYIKDNIIYTPPLTQNILPGITRGVVADICRENKIRLKQRKIHYFDIVKADEIFITNSIAEIMPVSEIDKYKVNEKIPGYFTAKLMQLYKEKVNIYKEMVKQKNN